MSTRPERIVFAGTPDFAARILERMLAAGLPVAAVLTQPDRPAGRGRRLTPSPVKRRAADHGLPVLQPPSLRDTDARAEVAARAPDLLVVAAYGLILPPAVLDLPRHGCINVHASLLPRWRGAAPVERAIMAGDTETGVCIMQMDAGLDTGPVRLARSRVIGATETGGELETALADLGADALIEVLADLDAYPPVPQPEAGVTYAAKLNREDARIDFSAAANVIARRIRAMNPARPVAVTCRGTRVQLLRAGAIDAAADAPPGTLVRCDREGISIACGEGLLQLTEARVVRGKATVMDAPTLARTQTDLFVPGALLEPA